MPAGAFMAMHAPPPMPKVGTNPMWLSKAVQTVGAGGLGATSIFDASAKALANGYDSLYLDQQVMTITPTFTVSTASLFVIGVFSPINIVSGGSWAYNITLAGTLTLDSAQITSTNPYHTWLYSGGTGKTIAGFGTDGRYANNTWANQFNGWRINSASSLTMRDVPHPGIKGSSDVPPGEVHNGLIWGSTNVTLRDIYTNGSGIAATLYAYNKTTNPTFVNINVTGSQYAHGFSHYESLGTMTVTNCVSTNNHDAGFNNEETNQSAFAACIVNVTGLTASGNGYDIRHENGNNGGGQDNQAGYNLTNCTLTSTVSLRTEGNQLTAFTLVSGNTITGTTTYVASNRQATTRMSTSLTGTTPATTSAGTGTITNTATGRQYTSIGTSTVYDEWTATGGDLAVGVFFHTPTALPNATIRLGDLLVSGTTKLRVFLTTTGLINLQDATGVNVFTSAAALTLNADYWFQLFVQRSAGLITFQHYAGDQCTTPVEAGVTAVSNANLGATNFTTFRLGQAVSNAWAGSVWGKRVSVFTNATGPVGWWS